MSGIAIIVRVYHDDSCLEGLLKQLVGLTAIPAASDAKFEIIIVDGASSSATAQLARRFRCRYLSTLPGRGRQIAAGISAVGAAGWYWVVHADSVLASEHMTYLAALVTKDEPRWGRFNIHLPGFPMIARLMNLRSRLTKICTGDQAMFFQASLLERVGGFPTQPLMEDVEVSKRLKLVAGDSFCAVPLPVETSPRRWREQGAAITVLAMWMTRYKYWRGISATQLYREYYGREYVE